MPIRMKNIKIDKSGKDGMHIEGEIDMDIDTMEITNSGRHGISYNNQGTEALGLLEQIIQKAYTKSDKQSLLTQVAKAHSLANQDPQGNKSQILSILDKVVSMTGDLASIGSFTLAIYQYYHTGITIDP